MTNTKGDTFDTLMEAATMEEFLELMDSLQPPIEDPTVRLALIERFEEARAEREPRLF